MPGPRAGQMPMIPGSGTYGDAWPTVKMTLETIAAPTLTLEKVLLVLERAKDSGAPPEAEVVIRPGGGGQRDDGPINSTTLGGTIQLDRGPINSTIRITWEA